MCKYGQILTIFLVSAFFFGIFGQNSAAFAQNSNLSGIGYGKTEDEAKENALDDLASTIKVRVYSKYSSSNFTDDKKSVTESTRFIKITSDVPILNPELTYSKEGGKIKCTAVITNIDAYIARLNATTLKINNMLSGARTATDKTLRFNLLERVLPLYDEFDVYAIVPSILGVENYDKPSASKEQIFKEYSLMAGNPPDLNIAADILTRPLKGRQNIFVAVPAPSPGGETTDFGLFFQKLISSRLNSAIDEQADYVYKCLYAESGGSLVMNCSLISGATAVSSSSIKIPVALLSKLSYKPKPKSMDELSVIGTPRGALKASVRISPENNPNILKYGDYFTILVRLNKPAYVYVVSYAASGGGATGVALIGGEGGFLRFINADNAGVWTSLGRFRSGYPLDASSVYLFAIENKPKDVKSLLPVYLRDKFYSAEKSKEEIATDILNIFNKLDGEKTFSSVNMPGAR